VKRDGAVAEFPSKPALTKALADNGADDVVHVFKGHKLSITTETIDRVTVG
jgi:hypothetical protein